MSSDEELVPPIPAQHVLFWSPRCHHSNNFLDILKQNDMLSEFDLVNVDDTVVHSSIVSVPTVLVDKLRLLKGSDAFAWINNEIKSRVVPVDLLEHGTSSVAFSDLETGDYSHGKRYAAI